MGKIGGRGCGALLLLAATVGPVLAQESKPAPPPFGPVPDPGKPILFFHRQETTSSLEVMEKLRGFESKSGVTVPKSPSTSVDLEFGLEVLERLPEGGFRATLRFGRIEATGLSLMDKDAPRFSSDAPLPKEGMDRLLFPRIVHLGDAVLPATLDAGGYVTAVEGCDAAAEARIRKLGLSKDERTQVVLALQADEVARAVNAALAVTPLPARALGKSASWTTDDPGPYIVPGTDMCFRQTLRVTEVRADVLRLEGRGKVEPRADSRLKDLGLVRRKPVIKTSKVESEYDLSRADGFPTNGEMTASVNYTSGETDVVFTKNVKSLLRRVAAWPSGKPAIPAPDTPPPK